MKARAYLMPPFKNMGTHGRHAGHPAHLQESSRFFKVTLRVNGGRKVRRVPVEK
jgi:hypothetical protein